MIYNFLNLDRKLYINNLIRNKILINLVRKEYNDLIEYLYLIIEYITIRFEINKIDYNIFWHQLTQNNNRDLIAFFNLLLPFIDDKEGTFELHKQIYNLSDISTKFDPKKDANNESINKYLISNIQYNLYLDTEYHFSIVEILHNVLLLIDTIDHISNKLFVNWLNVIPITLHNYMETSLYNNSIKLISNEHNSFEINNISVNSRLIQTTGLLLIKTYFAPSNNLMYATPELLKNIYKLQDESNNFNSDILSEHKGISISDIFNTIYYDLFEDILHIKWLIYQYTFDDYNHDQIFIEILNENIAIPGLYMNDKWDELNIEQQLLFISKWNIFKNLVITNNNIAYNNLLLNIIIFMERNYNKMESIVNRFKYKRITKKVDIEIIDNEDMDDEDEYEIKISSEKLINRIKVLPIEDIYMYLLDTIQKFMLTWYGKKIILSMDDNIYGVQLSGLTKYKFNYESYFTETITKDGLHKYDSTIIFPETLTIKYKFIYNFAKAFVLHYDSDRIQPYKRSTWRNLQQNDRLQMIDLLNKTYYEALVDKNNDLIKPINKLNIMSFASYYKRVYYNTDSIYNKRKLFDGNKVKSYGEVSINLGTYIGNQFYQHIRDRIVDITFECLIMKGLLSQLIFNKQLTDISILGRNYEELKQNQYANLQKYVLNDKMIRLYKSDAYYFLTDKLYGDLNEIHRDSKKDYFDLILSEYRWYSFYAVDWIAQINFFHHYINNRVLYITGATGQGKSTQIPKLFLYALKMIDNKLNGRVICSQPRTDPTINNSVQISWELGVPINEMSVNYKKQIKTFNPYVQYQSQTASHLVDSHHGLLLKLVTDKLLSMELLRSPIFKQVEKTYDDDNSAESIEFNIYSRYNLYDVIIVDESHEHNINMDIILTIARDTIRYNNSLRLVIISATIGDDEYIYRRYYKDINDNFTFPYNNNNAKYNLSRLYVDRRIHISPPGETTQHIVKDIYLDKDPVDYLESEQLAINKALELISTTLFGDILLFSLSKTNVNELCEKINKMLYSSSNVICLPFYSELPAKWNIFDSLGKKVKLITTHREDLFIDMFQTSSTFRTVPLGTYDRVIIIATNIAEASITVDSLKYVIDTGYNIIVSDNPYSNEPTVEKSLISETSRIQRRGRVGRVSSGIVYYMYTKDSHAHIKSSYKICIQNIYLELYDLTPRIYNDSLLISDFDFINHIYNKFETKQAVRFISNKFITNSKILANLIIHHYTENGILLPSVLNFMSKYTHRDDFSINKLREKLLSAHLYGFNIDQTYKLINERPTRFISGYNISEDIYDRLGNFYIIHPEENNIKRNLLTGKIIEIKKKDVFVKKDYLLSEKIFIYYQKCFYQNLLIDKQLLPVDGIIFYNNDIIKFTDIKFEYEKSISGRILQNIVGQFKIHENEMLNRSFMITLIYSYVCKLDEVVALMIALLVSSDLNLSNLNKNINIFKNMYDSDDLFVYYSLAKKIYEKYVDVDTTKILNIKTIFDAEKDMYIKQKNIILKNLKNKSNYWELDIPLNVYVRFNQLDNTNRLNSNKHIYNYMIEFAKNLTTENIINFMGILNSYAINVDHHKAHKILKLYIDIKNIMNKLKNAFNIPNSPNELLWFSYYLPLRLDINEFINIKKAFIYGFGLYQTIIYDPVSNSYLNINNLSTKYNISKYTLTGINEMAVYLFNNSIKNELSIIINSDLDTLVECNLYNYNPLFLETINTESIVNMKIFKRLIDKLIMIYQNKQKYINFLNTDIFNDDKLKKLHSYPNNYTKYILRLWTTETDFYKKYQQIGGNKHKIIKINLSKVSKIIRKLNINKTEFKNIINQYKYKIIDNYLYLEQPN